MRLFLLLIAAPTLLSACAPDPLPDEDRFGDARSLRLVSPANGATVQSVLTLRHRAGEDIALVRARVDGQAASGFEPAEAGALSLTLSPGRHVITLEGYDARRVALSEASVQVRVLDEGVARWVGIRSPADGSEPVNPVQFVVEASEDVARVALSADGWPLGETAPGEPLTWRFTGTGTPRLIEAAALDAEGEVLATDAITITVREGEAAPVSDFNQLLLALADTYPQDGTYAYYWPSTGSWSGSTRDILYQGRLVADDGGFSACYCSGITWELYLRAWRELDLARGGDGEDLNGLDADTLMTLRRDWYVRELNGPGPSVALDHGGLGWEVESFDDVLPGDIVQLWRTNGSGHTAIFTGWETSADGDRLGLRYLSCQGATDGFGEHSEYFGTHSGAVDPALVTFGRAAMPEDWR